jgi:dienelactone hydrolase
MTSTALKTLLATTTLACAVGAPAAAASPPTQRGALLHATRVAQLSAHAVHRVLRAFKIDDARVRFGVDGYRLRYATIGVDGRPTTASALVVLPRGARTPRPVIAYEHGTTVRRSDAPSTAADSDARDVALLFGSAGYATVAPDYLGLGTGPGHHPYLDPATETSASVDALRAARAFALRDGRRLEDRVLVTGFSQGGQAAMALGHALQDAPDPRLRLAGLAPFSGPYDLDGAELPAIVSGQLDPALSGYNLSYALTSWQRRYRLYGAASDVWRDPRIPRLFDGEHSDTAILAALPHRLDDLFTPAFLAQLRAPSGALLAALRAGDGTCDWKPAVPARLYAARGDDAVAFANGEHCRADLRAAGADVPLVDVGDVDHFTSERLAAPRVLRFFDGLR